MATCVNRDLVLATQPCFAQSSKTTPVLGHNVIQNIFSSLTVWMCLISTAICAVAAGHIGMTAKTHSSIEGDNTDVYHPAPNASTGTVTNNVVDRVIFYDRHTATTPDTGLGAFVSQSKLTHGGFIQTARRRQLLKLISLLIRDSALFKKLNSHTVSLEMLLKSLDDTLSQRSSIRMDTGSTKKASNEPEHNDFNENIPAVSSKYLRKAHLLASQQKDFLLFGLSYREGSGTRNQTYSNKNTEVFTLKRRRRNTFQTMDSFNRDMFKYQFHSVANNEKITQQLLKPEHGLLSNRGRRSNSGESSSVEDLIASTEDQHLTQTLHFVDKLQANPEPCNIPGKRIIILKNQKFKPEQFFPVFVEEVKRTVQIANTINDLLLYTKSPPETFLDMFFAMTQSLVETGPLVTGCAIAFNLVSSGPPAFTSTVSQSSTPAKPPQPAFELQSLFPYSYRSRDGSVVITDLSRLYKPQTTTWFSVHVNRSTEGLLKSRNRTYANRTDIGNLTSFNAKWNTTVAVDAEDGYWATPYYDCLLRSWVIQYSIPFYQLKGLTPEFK